MVKAAEEAEGRGTAHGTFGELLQGMLPGARRRFLVTLPVDAWSHAAFRVRPDGAGVTVRPAAKHKAQLLAARMLHAYGCQGGGSLELDTAIPEGKGLASSSADLVATARAVADALGLDLGADRIESFLRGIEPSDGVMHPGIVSYYHREVRLRERLGFLPPLTIVAHDPGGAVDSVSFNRSAVEPSGQERKEYGRLLGTLRAAVRDGDLGAVGEVGTRSAELHLHRFPRADFADMDAICREHAGLGLVVAHSGTVLGILLGRHEDDPERTERVRADCAGLPGTVSVYRSLGPADYAIPAPACPTQHAGHLGGKSALR